MDSESIAPDFFTYIDEGSRLIRGFTEYGDPCHANDLKMTAKINSVF